MPGNDEWGGRDDEKAMAEEAIASGRSLDEIYKEARRVSKLRKTRKLDADGP